MTATDTTTAPEVTVTPSAAGAALVACRPVVVKVCAVCGMAFSAAPHAKYCGKNCLKKAYRRRRAANKEAERQRLAHELFGVTFDLVVERDRDIASFVDPKGDLWLRVPRDPRRSPPPAPEKLTLLASYAQYLEPVMAALDKIPDEVFTDATPPTARPAVAPAAATAPG